MDIKAFFKNLPKNSHLKNERLESFIKKLKPHDSYSEDRVSISNKPYLKDFMLILGMVNHI